MGWKFKTIKYFYCWTWIIPRPLLFVHFNYNSTFLYIQPTFQLKHHVIKSFLLCWSKMSVSSVFRVFQSHPLFMSWERCKRWLTCSSKPQESHKMDFLYSFFVPFLDYISPIVTSLRQELSLFLLLYVVSWPLRQVRVKNSHFAEHLFVSKKYYDLFLNKPILDKK